LRGIGWAQGYLDGHEISCLGGDGFLGTVTPDPVTAGDGPNQEGGKMGPGAEYVNERRENKRKQMKAQRDPKRKDPDRTVLN